MLEFYLSLVFDEKRTDDFVEIYNNYERYIYKVAIYFTNDHHNAEDAMQIALKNIALYVDKISPLSEELRKIYIYKVTKHAAFKVMKKEDNNTEPLDTVYEACSDDDVIKSIVDSDRVERIKAYIGNMEQKYKDVVSLYLLYDLNFRQISELLDLPLSTVETRFYKGKKMIKDKFKEEGYE